MNFTGIKKRKRKIIDLLTNLEEIIVTVRIFKENSDSKTMNDQIDILKNQFNLKKDAVSRR